MNGERAWSSEDTEAFCFKVVFTVFHGIVIGLSIRSKAPKLNVRLEAEAYWLRCGKVTPRSYVNFNCGIRVYGIAPLRSIRNNLGNPGAGNFFQNLGFHKFPPSLMISYAGLNSEVTAILGLRRAVKPFFSVWLQFDYAI
jgi:hypothetical protein